MGSLIADCHTKLSWPLAYWIVGGEWKWWTFIPIGNTKRFFSHIFLAGFENSRQMADWEHLLGLLGTSDVRTKISNGEEIITALSPPNAFQKGDDMGQFIDGLTPWINNSNFKVCLYLISYHWWYTFYAIKLISHSQNCWQS